MFDNIGGKIKGLAKVVCWIGIIASAITAYVLWDANSYYNPTFGIGLIVLVVGPLVSWIGTSSIYALGQIAEDLHVLRISTDESTMKPKYRAALAALKKKQYDEAINLFEEVSSFGDSSTMILECRYNKAADFKKNGKYAEAIESFKSVGTYKMAGEQIKDCWYQMGTVYLAEKQYDAAFKAFEAAGNYKNACEMLLEISYVEAKELIQHGDKESACELFSLIPDYKDVPQIIAADSELSQLYAAYQQEAEMNLNNEADD